MKNLAIILLLLIFSANSYAIMSETGLDPLDQTGTARALGMGGAFIAVSKDINSLFYNPAGLADSKGVTLNYSAAGDISFGVDYITNIGNFGLGYVTKKYDDFNAGTIKTSYENRTLLVGYGVQLGGFSLGLDIKTMMSQRIYQAGIRDLASNNGYDVDGGIIWKANEYISLAVLQHNAMAGAYNMGPSEEAFPRSFKYGIALDVLGKEAAFYNDLYGLKAATDIEDVNIEGIGPKQNKYYGLEGSYGGWLFARIGSALFDDKGSSSFGLGYKISEISIDIASYKEPITEMQISYISISYSPEQLILQGQSVEKTKESAKQKEPFVLIAPEDDLITYDDNVTVSGRAMPKSTILVNGVSAYINDDGQFNALQPLLPGKNLIEIEFKYGDERKVLTRKVLKKARIIIAEEGALNKKIEEEITEKEKALKQREDSLKGLKDKGADVLAEETRIAEERKSLETRRSELYGERDRLKERKDKVENLVTLGVIEVSKEKSFAIEAKITRGEMITWLVRASELPIPKVEGPVFSDVPAGSIYAPYIKAAVDAGFVKLPTDNKFRPNDPVTDEEGEAFFRAFGVVK